MMFGCNPQIIFCHFFTVRTKSFMGLKHSAVFLYCRFSLYLKDPFSQINERSQQFKLFLCGVGKTYPCASI